MESRVWGEMTQMFNDSRISGFCGLHPARDQHDPSNLVHLSSLEVMLALSWYDSLLVSLIVLSRGAETPVQCNHLYFDVWSGQMMTLTIWVLLPIKTVQFWPLCIDFITSPQEQLYRPYFLAIYSLTAHEIWCVYNFREVYQSAEGASHLFSVSQNILIKKRMKHCMGFKESHEDDLWI